MNAVELPNVHNAQPVVTPIGAPLPADDEIDLRYYWGIVNRHRIGIIGLAVFVSLLAMLVVYALPPVYQASATLLIESQKANVVSIEEVYGLDSQKSEYLQTQFEILKSRELAETVIRKLGLENHVEFDPRQWRSPFGIKEALQPLLPFLTPVQLTDERRWQITVDAFQSKLAISPVLKTQLVRIDFESIDPELTHRVANALGEAYIESDLEARLGMTQRAAEWLTGRLGSLKENLQQAEERLQAFREQEQLVDVSGVMTLPAKELDELTAQMAEARRARADAENRFNQVRGLAADRLESIPSVLETAVVQASKDRVGQAQIRLAELSKRYGPKHPKLQAAQSEVDQAQRDFTTQLQAVISGFEQEYRHALANEQAVAASLASSKQVVQSISRKEYQLQELEREAETSRRLYDMFFTRIKETNETDFQAANARFTERAVKPFQPVKPRKSLIVGLTFLGSLVVGVLLAFLRESLDNTVKGPQDVEEKLMTVMLGMLPLLKDKRKKDERLALTYVRGSEGGFAEAIRTIRTGVVLSGLDREQKVIVVTSSIPGEGKTTLSSNLAMGLGQMENVLLIDADMRRPSVARDFGLEPGTPGLSNLVAGTDTTEACIQHHAEAGIDVLSAGVVPPNPLELLSSDRFKSLVADLRQRYDRIVIDSAPAQAVSDALVLSTQADALIYVVKSDSTPYQLAQNGLERLRHVGARIIGVVVNQVDVDARSYGYYGSYYGYHGYYDSYGYAGANGARKPGK
jgi:capsular exopolysaccharide synthesis family protein